MIVRCRFCRSSVIHPDSEEVCCSCSRVLFAACALVAVLVGFFLGWYTRGPVL